MPRNKDQILSTEEVLHAAQEALARALTPAQCTRWGAAVRASKRWRDGSAEETLYTGTPLPAFSIAHDEREAPYFRASTEDATRAAIGDKWSTIGAQPCADEIEGVLCSFADETQTSLCVWAQRAPESTLMGIGVDLASTDDFAEDERGDRFANLLYTEEELALVPQLSPDVATGRTMMFAAKEAAFKATSAPLRTWYRSHDEELFFEVRDFEMPSPTESAGTARTGRAKVACDKMGIARINLTFVEIPHAVLALALSDSAGT